MKSRKLFIMMVSVLMGVFITSGSGFAQMKIRYINTEKILAKYPAAAEVQKKLSEIRRKYEADFKKMQEDAQKLLSEIQKQSLLLSPEKKSEKEQQLRTNQRKMEQFYYEKLGPQGEFFKKNKELTDPLIQKINQVIKKIGEKEGFDYILDVAQGVVLFAKPQYDITEKVLEELNKTR